MKFNVLIVDDEKNIRQGLGKALEMDGHHVLLAEDGQEALDIIHEEEVDLIIADLRMPRLSGEELLRRVVDQWPTIPVIILTGHGTIETAVQAMRDGAFDFLTKPVNLDRLSLLVRRALSTRELVMQHHRMQEELDNQRRFSNIIGKSSAMHRIFDVVRQVAPTKASVMITGESGVGKELVADALHNLSDRRDKPFIKVHCAALSETLLESELFGHEKGSFTGAVARKRGRFELAHMGSIFLDEIGEISQNVQIKILRVLQEKKFERVGGEETIEVDTRIISATNKDLKAEIERGTFREDLYYRLNVVNIDIPPLRERKEDIPLLVSAFIKEFAQENNKPVEGIDHKANALLYNYSWPGNVRELRNCIESALVMCKGTIITPDDLPPSITESSGSNDIRIPVGSTLAEAEREIIRSTLNAHNGNKSRTAEVLGIGRKTLHRKIADYHLDDARREVTRTSGGEAGDAQGAEPGSSEGSEQKAGAENESGS
ncbi:MAG: sigma-54-dependent transcriptional regulator [Spirochaetaceae bacterium]